MGLNIGVIVFACAPGGEPTEWAARLFGDLRPLAASPDDSPLIVPCDVAQLAHHGAGALVVTWDLPWTIVTSTEEGYDPPAEAWIAEASRRGDVLVASMHSSTSSCGHAVYRAGQRVLRVWRSGYQAHASIRPAAVPAWYPLDPIAALDPHVAELPPEERPPVPDVVDTSDLAGDAFAFEERYVARYATPLLGADLESTLDAVRGWLRVRV